MDATCAIQASIHVFSLVRKYVSRILGTYQCGSPGFLLDNLNGEKSLARQLLHGILTVILLKKYSFW